MSQEASSLSTEEEGYEDDWDQSNNSTTTSSLHSGPHSTHHRPRATNSDEEEESLHDDVVDDDLSRSSSNSSSNMPMRPPPPPRPPAPPCHQPASSSDNVTRLGVAAMTLACLLDTAFSTSAVNTSHRLDRILPPLALVCQHMLPSREHLTEWFRELVQKRVQLINGPALFSPGGIKLARIVDAKMGSAPKLLVINDRIKVFHHFVDHGPKDETDIKIFDRDKLLYHINWWLMRGRTTDSQSRGRKALSVRC